MIIIIMVKKIITIRNLREKVYEAVKEFVVNNEVPPGNKINEDSLAIDLGVSKTPVREALSKLAHEGIVQIIPNRGSFKVKLSREDIYEVMLIREALEGVCVRLSAKHANERVIRSLKAIFDEFEAKDLEKDFSRYSHAHQKFHALIHQTSKSPRLIRILQSMYDLTHMLRVQYFSNPERVKMSLQTHRDLIDALQKKDGELAEKIRRHAIRSAYESLIKNAPQ